jgi:DNA-binding HxlR family transcriptional regulator
VVLIVRELLLGSHRFNELHRGVPKMSRTLLARRLTELEETGVVERRMESEGGHVFYFLTQAGEELRPIILQMGVWGTRWVQREVLREELDAGLLMWDIRRGIQRDRLPLDRVVVYFRFTDAPKEHQHYWLVIEGDDVDLCLKDPGCNEDLYVRSDVRTFTDVWLGGITLARAIREESVWLGGSSELRRTFPDWLGLSAFAGIERPKRPNRNRMTVSPLVEG